MMMMMMMMMMKTTMTFDDDDNYVAVWSMRRLPREARGGGQGCVHVEPGDEEQERATVRLPLFQELHTLPHQFARDLRQVHWLFHQLVVPAETPCYILTT